MENLQNFIPHVAMVARGDQMCDWFKYSSVIRGHHIYKDSFTSTIGKTLQSQRESDNDSDSFAVAFIENEMILSLNGNLLTVATITIAR